MKFSVKQLFIHVVCCLMFLALPYVFAPGNENTIDTLLNRFTIREFMTYLLLIGFFYLNYFILIPRLYFTHRYIQFFGIAVLFFLIIAIVPTFLVMDNFQFDLMSGNPGPPPDFGHGPDGHGPGGHVPHHFGAFDFFHNIFLFLVVLFISLTLKINNRLKRTEKEKVTAELSLLKAQINPHFLFNTLNSIYSLAIDNSDYTATAVVKLSGMMRYIISEAGHDFVSLDKEVAYISDYIELQQVRFDNTFKLTYNVNGNTASKKIAPLILLPFVENAFKHGVNPEADSSIIISINVHDNDLTLMVKNKKVTAVDTEAGTSGIGLGNTRNRLELLYPGKHRLEVVNRADDFTVNLTIQLV